MYIPPTPGDYPKGNTMEPLRLFVYGTLKRGQRNHDRYCQGAVDIQEAQVRGRLYEGPDFPVLEVPDEDILAIGTSNPLADVSTQQHFLTELRSIKGPREGINTSEDWDIVYGELLTFDDPSVRLVDLDYLEGYSPGGISFFKRVLSPILLNETLELAWVYTIEDTGIMQRKIASDHWPD